MKEEREDDMQFEDAENFKSGFDQLSFKQMVLKAYSVAMSEGSKELTRGGVMERIINGVHYQIPRGNQREIFINAVEQLRILVQPMTDKKKDKVGKYFEEYDKAVIELNKKYNKKIEQFNEVYTDDNQAYAVNKNFEKEKSLAHDDIEDWYEQEMAFIYRDKLMVAISYLLNEFNWFDESGYSF